MAWYNLGFRGRLLRLLGSQQSTFSHAKSLSHLKNLGFNPNTIYDIGAFHGDWSDEAFAIFPSATYILFDANPHNAIHLNETGHEYNVTALSNIDGVSRVLYLPKNPASYTGISLYREATEHFSDDKIDPLDVIVRRLDALASDQGYAQPDLIKIDVQGAEIDVLEGAGRLLDACSAIILEVSVLPYNEGAPLFDSIVTFAANKGFRMIDIAEIHRTSNGAIIQLDLLFVCDALYSKAKNQAGIFL